MLNKLLRMKNIRWLWNREAAVENDAEAELSTVTSDSAEGGGDANAIEEGGGVAIAEEEDVVLNVVDVSGAVRGKLHLNSSRALMSQFSFDDISENDIQRFSEIIAARPSLRRRIKEIVDDLMDTSSALAKLMDLIIPFNGGVLFNIIEKINNETTQVKAHKTEAMSRFSLYTSVGFSITALLTAFASYYIDDPKKKKACRQVSIFFTGASLLVYACLYFLENNTVDKAAIAFIVIGLIIVWFVMTR